MCSIVIRVFTIVFDRVSHELRKVIEKPCFKYASVAYKSKMQMQFCVTGYTCFTNYKWHNTKIVDSLHSLLIRCFSLGFACVTKMY